MIAASDPLEFVPHGRIVLAEHPSQIYSKEPKDTASTSEHSLLYKLTNFGIKDESLVNPKEDTQEWWCIRQVYHKEDDFKEDLQESQKEQKYEYMDSSRPPSRLKTDFNISIKSELMGGLKKDDVASAGNSRGSSVNSSANMSKKFNLGHNYNKYPRKRPLNPKTDSYYEEELYVKGCSAVWSKGLISAPDRVLCKPEHRETIACFTIENPIKHAAFANFHTDINNTMLIDALNSQIGDVKKNIKIEDTTEHIENKIMPSILLIDNKCMRVYALDGREYIASIPFQVKKVWPMKYGVLLEKDATPLLQNSMLPMSFVKLNESHNSSFNKSRTFPFNMSAKLRSESVSGYDQDFPLPTCFSLRHPLDEVTPILMKSSAQGLQYYNDGDLQIIFVSSEPSIILLYDWKLQTHSLWKIRKALRDECLMMCPNVNSSMFTQSCDFVGSPMHSMRNTTSWTSSPFQSKKMTTPSRSRQNSPMANVFHQQGLSPHTSIGQASSTSMVSNTVNQAPPSLPLYPDICLDHIWTDSQVIRRDQVESPIDLKAFLHQDLVGHDYLCFMVKVAGVKRLYIVRLQKSHYHGQMSKTNIIVGSISSVIAKDAVVLDHLKMIALIDQEGNIILQSGNNYVGKVHVGGILARLIDSPYTKRTTFQSPFPRRSSLLPTRCESNSFDDSALHLLSPVPHSSVSRLEPKEGLERPTPESEGPRALCDAAGSRVSVRVGAALFRIALPERACSPLVARCCTALTQALPKDITMQVIIRWYGVRNAPGTQDLISEQEWIMFANLLLSLIGYDVEKLSESKQNEEEHIEVVTKKQRTSSDGSQDDWEYMLNSKMHKLLGNPQANMLNLHPIQSETRQSRPIKKEVVDRSSQFNINTLLFPYTMNIFYAFHLVYEDLKLNTLLGGDLKPLSAFLHQIAKDLCLDKYVNHYWLDFPVDYNFEYDESDTQMTEPILDKLTQPNYFTAEPPNIFSYINSMFKGTDVGYYPHMADVNNMSRDIIEILSVAGKGSSPGVRALGREGAPSASTPRRASHTEPHAAILLACERGVAGRDVDALPPALALWLRGAGARARRSPGARWPAAAYALALRRDLRHQARLAAAIASSDEYMESLALEALEKETTYSQNPQPLVEPQLKGEEDAIIGMEHLHTRLLSLLYPKDHRMTEVFNLLQSSIPVNINLTQRPEVSDHEFIEEQEKYLYAVNTRTMALPVARGMLTLRSLPCSATEPLGLPRLCTAGRGPPPRRSAVALADAPCVWPTFHNGVAAGLALVPVTGHTIHSSWIIFNKPRGAQDMSTEHAGFLLALGLNGHLKDMPFMNTYEYLVKCHEMISIGLLLGLAATYRGTMDVQATKMMSIHLEPLLPSTSIELDIQQGVLVAALLGMGLLYTGTAHAHYAQVLLHEIGKPPGQEAENCTEREGYALAAGLALGLVCLRAGTQHHLAHIAPTLRTYMLGGDRRVHGGQKERQKPSSRNGVTVNLDVTSPGATVALGLLFLRSGSAAVADWLRPPATAYLLDFVRPDLLMLRVIARGLVLWDEIEPTEEWVDSQVPATIKPYCFVKPTEDNIDYEAMNQAYCNITAGACFALGLRYAGAGCELARDVALRHARLLLRLAARAPDLAGATTLETCTAVCLLAAGMIILMWNGNVNNHCSVLSQCYSMELLNVINWQKYNLKSSRFAEIMAGRGDLEVLRVCRRLRARIPTAPRAASAPAPLTHGAQMAVHSTIGLLFLGGGRSTLSTSPEAVAALIIAFFPKFPTHSEDNRYHLQAFRHLYVLAVEPRLILPRDLDTGKLCYAHIQVIDLSGAVKEMKAPCIIPELDTLREVKINDPRYWPITFHRDHNWDQLKTFLNYTWCIDISQRAGCLSYCDDPDGFLTLLAQTLTLDKSNIWSVTPESIELFTNDERVKNFVKLYLSKGSNSDICGDCLLVNKKRKGVKNEVIVPKQCVCRKYTKEEQEHVQSLSMVTYECVVKDILCVLPIWTTYLKIIKTMKTEPTAFNMWQIKLLLAQVEDHNRRVSNEMAIDGEDPNEPLISTEFTLAIKQKVSFIFDKWELKITPFLRKYLGMPSNRKISMCDNDTKRTLASYLTYHDLPKGILKNVVGDEISLILCDNFALSADAVSKIGDLLR